MRKLDNRGMTLVELTVAMMISMIVGGVVLSVLFTTLNLYTKQQIKNRQYIIIDHVEEVIHKELRYATTVQIADILQGQTSEGDTNYYLSMVDGELTKDGTDILCGKTVLQDHTLDVSFSVKPNGSDSCNIYVKVQLDKDEEYAAVESFYVKALNLELEGTAVEKQGNPTGQKVYYTKYQ